MGSTWWTRFARIILTTKPSAAPHASLVTSMGRMAAHTGTVVTCDQILNCDHEFAPEIEGLVIDGPAPIKADANGLYSLPQPGITTKREYA